MPDHDDREALLARGDALWRELSTALDAHLEEPLGPSTDWTGRDVYAHFARWCAQAASDTRRLLAGEAPQSVAGTENEINERWRAEDRALDAAAARDRCTAARADLKSVIRSLTDSQWRAFGETCAQDVTAAHIEPHLRMIGQ
jgi:hypothetical protein